ncbi:hypothetical protein [Undibacterium flavidum]|uniref:Uncharacterized protein n=1 Tax=Undibacterium flavidum TaxID=2762297 RepID=A0ABR6YH37_9BURK|nr:hypothetical protein [Undibacterium flavidum]MBC3875901.1 hypothetical protein [Undibacterium flavidum]
MNGYICRLLFIIVTLSFPTLAWSHNLNGEWILKIENKKHQTIATLNIQFTKQKAESCIAGEWSRIIVLSSTTKDKNFFPVSDMLSYSIEKNRLAIGRNEICDAYLMLNGRLRKKVIRGDYYALGMGGASPLGFFSLSKKN